MQTYFCLDIQAINMRYEHKVEGGATYASELTTARCGMISLTCGHIINMLLTPSHPQSNDVVNGT